MILGLSKKVERVVWMEGRMKPVRENGGISYHEEGSEEETNLLNKKEDKRESTRKKVWFEGKEIWFLSKVIQVMSRGMNMIRKYSWSIGR